MKKILDSAINGLIPSITENLSNAANEVINGTSAMLTPGAGIINHNGQVSENPQAFGFAFEHLQAIGFNLKASLQDSDLRAKQIPADGTLHGADIVITDRVGKIISEIQAKSGSSKYVKKSIDSGHYEGDILTNSENQGFDGTKIQIEVESVTSFSIPQGVAQWVAEHPYTAANLMYAAATIGEVGGAGVQGAVINSTINVLLQSIKFVGAYCRGEQELTRQELLKFSEVAVNGLKSGFIRGVAIKTIHKLTDGNAFAALGFTVGVEAIPALIKVLNNEITIEQAIQEVGARAFTSAMVTALVLIFPPIGTSLLSLTIIQAIWSEISPEWKKYINAKGSMAILGGGMIAAGASAGTAVTVASTLGVAASTGTAISGLSGAAATNATLAWLGGGTLAAGGGGVAAGSAILSVVATGGAVIAVAGVGVVSKKIWDNLSEEQRQEIADKIDNSTPEQVKVAYGVTVEKATEILGVTSNWIGSNTSKTAKHIQALAKSQEAKMIFNQTTQIAGAAGTLALGSASVAGKESLKQINNLSQKIGSWWQKD